MNLDKLYLNKEYGIGLKYHGDWNPNPLYQNRYEGKEGFFQINAISGSDKIDSIVYYEINHSLLPYGTKPIIKKLTIQGQDARLILPSKDQSPLFENVSELIVVYPTPIHIEGNTYSYFVLHANQPNIEEISKTLKFIR